MLKMTKERGNRFCTFNSQGLLDKAKQRHLADDFIQKNIKALLIQETHIQDQGMHILKSTDNKTTLHLYNSGHNTKSRAGVVILVDSNIKLNFSPISERICFATMKISNDQKLILLSAYAPTMEITKNNPEVTNQFYNQLSSTVKLFSKRDALIIGGDFNAKTRLADSSVFKSYNQNVGKYAKSTINENGQLLLEFAKTHNLRLTNTFFKHKPSHQTTWESPVRINQHMDANSNEPRRNPYRNQIDYLITRNSDNMNVFNSRSYSNKCAQSDHRPVIADIQVKWKYMKHSKPNAKLNIELLQNPEYRERYNEAVSELFANEPAARNNQERWDKIVKVTNQAAVDTVGFQDRNKVISIPEISVLSEQQKKIHHKMNSTKNKETRASLRKSRNKILTQIHNKIRQEENRKVEHALADLENSPDDSTKMYKAVRNLNKLKPKSPLLIKDSKSGSLTSNEQDQANIIAKYFQEIFFKDAKPPEDIPPTPMSIPFTVEEIRSAIRRLKNNKSPGSDGLVVELLKCAPEEIYQLIADIYNEMAATGDHPKELIEGLLCALQKPGKKKGPLENLRPIILLSVLRKILAVCMIDRIGERVDKEIPPTQAAYRRGRSTTEHVFATKMIIERTISARNETVYLILLDMSKAFDSINRALLINDLKHTIDNDELHLIKILLGVKLSVKCGQSKSDFFDTDTGAPQGDCASANEFTYYLAKTLLEANSAQPILHNYVNQQQQVAISEVLSEHNCSTPTQIKHITINQEYADDMSKITSSYSEVQNLKNHLPRQLKQRDLTINETKTEEYTITNNKNCDNLWKSCKLLGSLLDTDNDIKRRKGLAIDTARKLHEIFMNNRISIANKMRTFNAYVTSVFLYNSELWCLKKNLRKGIDSFHRRMLRIHVLNIRWPQRVSNEQVYARTNAQPWSEVVDNRRLRWFGHVARMSPLTPARQALEYALQPYDRPRGRPQLTWINVMREQLKAMNLTWDEGFELAQDRVIWKDIINM